MIMAETITMIQMRGKKPSINHRVLHSPHTYACDILSDYNIIHIIGSNTPLEAELSICLDSSPDKKKAAANTVCEDCKNQGQVV